MPYPHWGGECRVREHPHEERTPQGVVSWTQRVEWEWIKKFEWGRRPTKGRSGIKWDYPTEHERQRWRDEQTRQERVGSNSQKWGTNPVSFLRHNDLSLEFWRGDGNLVREFFSVKIAINKDSKWLNRNCRETDRNHSQWKTNDPNETTTGQWYNFEWRSRGTHTILYTYWGSVCVRVREHQHEERTPSGVVFWTEQREIQQL